MRTSAGCRRVARARTRPRSTSSAGSPATHTAARPPSPGHQGPRRCHDEHQTRQRRRPPDRRPELRDERRDQHAGRRPTTSANTATMNTGWKNEIHFHCSYEYPRAAYAAAYEPNTTNAAAPSRSGRAPPFAATGPIPRPARSPRRSPTRARRCRRSGAACAPPDGNRAGRAASSTRAANPCLRAARRARTRTSAGTDRAPAGRRSRTRPGSRRPARRLRRNQPRPIHAKETAPRRIGCMTNAIGE